VPDAGTAAAGAAVVDDPVNDALGVSGGVVIGMPTTLLEVAAAMLGTCPAIRGGLLSTPVWDAADGCVMMDEFELDRAGEAARGWTNEAVSDGGEGAVSELAESRCLW
jgi:hypothetical protein